MPTGGRGLSLSLKTTLTKTHGSHTPCFEIKRSSMWTNIRQTRDELCCCFEQSVVTCVPAHLCSPRRRVSPQESRWRAFIRHGMLADNKASPMRRIVLESTFRVGTGLIVISRNIPRFYQMRQSHHIMFNIPQSIKLFNYCKRGRFKNMTMQLFSIPFIHLMNVIHAG